MKTTEFLETIFGENEGYIFISSLDEEGRLTQHKSFRYPTLLPQIEKYVEMRQDQDLYFSPMLYSVPRRNKNSVSCTPVVYADTDSFDPDGYLVKPSINIVTSNAGESTRRASFWLLDETYDVNDVSTAARAIAMAHARKENGKQVGVDPSGWDLSQLLRLPGSTNNKYLKEKYKDEYTQPYEVFVEDTGSSEIYSLDDITAAYSPDNLPEIPEADEDFPGDLPEPKVVLRRVTSSPKLSELYNNTPRSGQDWSDTMYLFLSECFRQGFTPEEALVAGWHASCNKYKRDGRPMEDLWKYDVTRAYVDPNNRPLAKVEKTATDVPDIHRPKDEGLHEEVELILLTEDEQKQLTRTFIDDYVDWAAEKTDAPAPYHVASALSIMSAVLGEWGVGDPQFGELPLGLFFVIMGETTETRKTTARKLMKKVLRMTEVGDYHYLLTSDATAESMIDELSEREHQASVYDRDEAQQLIADIKGGKGYMSGFFETLNELYDGIARGRLRAQKRTRDTPTVFVQYLMGIRSQIQENLEMRDLSSGWGPRNIFVRGESPPRTRETDRLRQGSAKNSGVDREFLDLVKQITSARDFWSSKCGGDRSNKFKVYFEEDAWIRQTDLVYDLKDYFSEHPRFTILSACFERLALNVMKVAILFAMMDKRTEANMTDVLNARYLAAQWVEDMVIMVEGVNESMEQKIINKIETFIIEHDGFVTYASALKWATREGIKRRDFNEYIETMSETDILSLVEDGKGKKSLELVDA